MPTLPHFAPAVNETATAFLAREAAAWEDLTPADLEPADGPTEADRDWNAQDSPLNNPSNPLRDERWTVTGAEEWTRRPSSGAGRPAEPERGVRPDGG
jgi:hypothetical protein